MHELGHWHTKGVIVSSKEGKSTKTDKAMELCFKPLKSVERGAADPLPGLRTSRGRECRSRWQRVPAHEGNLRGWRSWLRLPMREFGRFSSCSNVANRSRLRSGPLDPVGKSLPEGGCLCGRPPLPSPLRRGAHTMPADCFPHAGHDLGLCTHHLSSGPWQPWVVKLCGIESWLQRFLVLQLWAS